MHRQDSLGKAPVIDKLEEITKPIPLRLDEDDGTPKFGDKIKAENPPKKMTPAPRKVV